MTVSIIIPVYNSEKYLQDCLDSVLSQTFTDFEVLLVDDGSKDGSGAICDAYAAKDSRIRVLHKENGGVSSARNHGIDNARGEYIVFADSDDRMTDVYLEHLMQSEADLVLSGVQKFGEKDTVRMPARRDDFGIGGFAAHWNTPPEMNYLYCYTWAKRFRTDIIRAHGIRFEESLFFSEDMCFNMSYYYFAESFTEVPYPDYLYRILNITRDEKYRMSAQELTTHHDYLEDCFRLLYERIASGSLSFVRDNTNLRLVRKFYSFLMQKEMNQATFVRNVKLFREKEWAPYMLGLLKGKKEMRVLREAVRFPVLTDWVENRLNHAVSRFSHR